RKGFRSGEGQALAVVFPTSLLQLWRILQACVAADKIVIMQAANTGLTEGSTPSGNDYDRDIVIVIPLRSSNSGIDRLQGIIVTEITPNGPASNAGFQINDIIINVDNKPTLSS
ncbi:PDZ domain-containing protein, partial [Serratia ureilytica]|nr:PDZ domain-containing protein [Serratia ureilytica]